MAEPLSGAASLGHNRGPLGNMTQLDALKFLDRYADVDEQVKQALARRKELRAEIEAAGCPKPAWDRFKKDRELSGVLRERYDGAYRQLMIYDRKPVGYTVSADTLNDPDADPATKHMVVADMKRIDAEAEEAGAAGRRRDLNPYPPGSEEAQRYDVSWLRGQSTIAERMGATGQDNGAPRRRGRPPGSKNKAREAAPESSEQTQH